MNKPFLAVFGLIIVVAGVTAYGALFTVHQTQQALSAAKARNDA